LGTAFLLLTNNFYGSRNAYLYTSGHLGFTAQGNVVNSGNYEVTLSRI